MNEKKVSSGPKKARFGSRRSEVVDLLQRGVGTVSEIADRLRLTNNAVRSHLLALERDELVQRVGSRAGFRRPHEVYQLTARAHKHLAQPSSATLSALLTALKRHLPSKALAVLLSAGGKALAFRFSKPESEESLSTRVKKAARVLNSLGGTAQVEKETEVFCVHNQGCPLADVVTEHPEVCGMVGEFLAGLTRAQVQEKCLQGTHPRCRFIIKSPATGE